MTWTDLKKAYGFNKPYDFNLAVPALLNIGFLGLFIIMVAWGLVARGHFTFNSERFYFYVYVFAGIVLATLAIGKRWLYWPLLIFFLLEFSLGVWGKGLTPADAGTEFDHRSNYHPLLQTTLAPNFRTDNGQLTLTHNSLGMRDTGAPIPPLKTDGLIFVFGGSTTYDIWVGQGHTWVERLNAKLGPPYQLFNFGAPGYSTAENLIQTAFYGDINGVYPSCAVYYIGWNDIRNANLANLDRAYANFHLLSQVGNARVRPAMNVVTVSPLLKLLVKQASYFLDTVPYPNPKRDANAQENGNETLRTIFQRNVATITAINKSRNVKTIVVGQMLNREMLNGGKGHKRSHGWLPFVEDGDVWALQSDFNDMLKKNSSELGYAYIDAGIDKFDPSDFVDSGHFNANGSEKFASSIAEGVRRACPSS